MSAGLRALGAAAAVLALGLLGCSPPVGSGNGCNATCPVGCNISSDCLSCVAESTVAGLGTACVTASDCCTGTCQGGICTASGLSLGGTAGTGTASTGGSGTGTSHGSSTSGMAGSTGGNPTTCTPSNPPYAGDTECGDIGVWVCNPSGMCVSNCNYDPSYCGSVACLANGHCQTPTSSGGSTGATKTSSAGGSGSAGNGAGGGTSGSSSSGSSSSGGVASSSSSTSAGGSSTSSGGSSSSGGAPGCGGTATEYDGCSTNSDCACPMGCVSIPSLGSYCLTPCASYTTCELDEVCNTQLSPASCYPNYCEPSINTAWGACAGANDTGNNQTGTCNMFSDNEGPFGVCVAGGTAATNAACAFSGGWSTVPSQQCVVNDLCVTFPSETGGTCVQGCDPSGSLDSASCTGSTSCESISNTDPYLGICQ